MPETAFETPQPVQTTESKSADWTKIILAAVVGLGLLAGSAYAGYYYGVESSKFKSQTSNPQPKTQNQVTPRPEADRPLDETPEPITPPVTDPTSNWKTYTDTINKIEFQYPPYKAVSSSKLQPYNFLTGVRQDGTSVSIANVGGGQIDIYNNPEQLSLEEVFKKRAYQEIPTFAEDKAVKIDQVNGVLRYERWSLPDEVITIHFVYNGKYVMASRGVYEETSQQAEEELVSIMETFKFLD